MEEYEEVPEDISLKEILERCSESVDQLTIMIENLHK